MLSLVFAILLVLVASVSSSGPLDPLGVVDSLNAVHDKVINDVDSLNRNLKDSLTPDPSNGEIIGDKDPAQPSTGLFSSLHLPGLPNLFSGLACIGSASLLTGTCDAASACASKGRVMDGKGLCLDKNVCCVDTLKCGSLGLLNNTIFSSPNYPEGTKQAGQCTMTVKKLGFHIRAVRVVIEDLELSQPNANGECNADGLWVEGVNPGSEVGRICGKVSSQHLYFPVGESTDDSIRVKVVLSPSNFMRRWLVRIVQIEMLSMSLPPPGCSMYFTGTSGTLVSFNANVANLTALGNLASLKYAVCLRKEAGFCKIEFEPVFFNMGPGSIRARRNPHPMRFRPVSMHRPAHVSHGPLKIAGASRPMKFPTEGVYSEAMLHKLLEDKLEAKMREYGLSNLHAPATPYATPAPVMHAPQPSTYYHPTNEIIDESLYEPIVDEPAGADFSAASLFAHNPMSKVCAGQDVITFPPPDDETNGIHCGSNFHGGGTLTTSSRPFVIRINNKGLVHGQGFIIKYRHVIC